MTHDGCAILFVLIPASITQHLRLRARTHFDSRPHSWGTVPVSMLSEKSISISSLRQPHSAGRGPEMKLVSMSSSVMLASSARALCMG